MQISLTTTGSSRLASYTADIAVSSCTVALHIECRRLKGDTVDGWDWETTHAAL